jgi:Uma2 family endonuclease
MTVTTAKWTLDDYHRLIEVGLLESRHVELLNGEIIEMPPEGEPLQDKMWDYLNSGLSLGWLINPQNQQVEIYRQNQDIEIVQFPVSLSGEDVLPGFALDIPTS